MPSPALNSTISSEKLNRYKIHEDGEYHSYISIHIRINKDSSRYIYHNWLYVFEIKPKNNFMTFQIRLSVCNTSNYILIVLWHV